MKRTTFLAALSAVLALSSTAPLVHAAYVIAGELQTEQGDASDWDPTGSSLIMSDIGGGLFSVSAHNLVLGQAYDFKVVDDEGAPPAEWGNPEITPNQLTVWGDADGSIEITVDTNVINNIGQFATWINFDNGPLQVVGDFMDEAGGAGDWNPADPAFLMTPQGNGYYTYNAVISTPGIYQFKASFGMGWDDQVGTEGFNNNAITKGFDILVPNQAIVMYVDLANRQLGVINVPEPSTLLLGGVSAIVALSPRRKIA